MSETKNLHEALLAVQANVGTLPKDGTNPHFGSKFTPLDTIVEKVGPLLAANGLTWTAFPCFGPNGEPALRYKLTHAASGESESDTMPLLASKTDPQGQGSALTYARRYALTAVLNLVADADDDGHRGSTLPAGTAAGTNGTERVASEGQQRLVFARAQGVPPSVLVGIMRDVAGREALMFDSEAEAQAWLDAAMPKLPARLVTPIVEALAKEGAIA